MTLTLKINHRLERRLREEAARRGVEPNSLAVAAIEENLRWGGSGSRLSRQESKLLTQINAGLAEELWERYDRLVSKRRAQTLTPQEHRELMQLTNTIEEDNAHRIRLLAQLARLRNVPLPSVMRELGIRPRRTAGD